MTDKDTPLFEQHDDIHQSYLDEEQAILPMSCFPAVYDEAELAIEFLKANQLADYSALKEFTQQLSSVFNHLEGSVSSKRWLPDSATRSPRLSNARRLG